MPSDETARVYRELAEDFERQGQAQMRDRFLVLAADAAFAAGQKDEAERLRNRLLQHNPHHLLKPYSSFAEAMKSADVQNYVGTLRRNHPYEKAEKLLQASAQGSPATPAPRKEPPPTRDDLKVFPLKDAPEEPKAGVSRTAPHPRPTAPKQPVQPAAPVRAVAAPQTLPLQREPGPLLDRLRATRPEKEDGEPTAGAWVTTVLFLVLLVAGIFLAAFTLARPFLPPEWF